MDMPKKNMHDIWYFSVNEILHEFPYTRYIQLKDNQTNG